MADEITVLRSRQGSEVAASDANSVISDTARESETTFTDTHMASSAAGRELSRRSDLTRTSDKRSKSSKKSSGVSGFFHNLFHKDSKSSRSKSKRDQKTTTGGKGRRSRGPSRIETDDLNALKTAAREIVQSRPEARKDHKKQYEKYKAKQNEGKSTGGGEPTE